MRKMRYLLWLLVLLLALGTAAACGADNGEEVSMEGMMEKAQDTNEFTFDYVITHHEDDQVFSGTMWIQENKQKIRMEEMGDFEEGRYGDFEGQAIEYIMDKEEQEFIIYTPEENLAIIGQIPEGLVVDNPQEQTEKVSEEDAAEAEDLGTQQIDGVECQGWKISNYGDENNTAEMWLHKEYGLPVKIEVFENDELIMTMEYKNLTVGDIPADTFEIPEGVEILDVGV